MTFLQVVWGCVPGVKNASIDLDKLCTTQDILGREKEQLSINLGIVKIKFYPKKQNILC